MHTSEINAGGGGGTLQWTSILLVGSSYRNRNKLQPDGPQLAYIQTLVRPLRSWWNKGWYCAHTISFTSVLITLED